MKTLEVDLIALKLKELRALVEADVKASRERSLVLTKLDEAGFWLSGCEDANG